MDKSLNCCNSGRCPQFLGVVVASDTSFGQVAELGLLGITTHYMEAIPSPVPDSEKPRKWKLFGIGLAVRLVGLLLIWLGDGHESVFRKALVVLGLILSIGGIGVLRYLLVSGFRRK